MMTISPSWILKTLNITWIWTNSEEGKHHRCDFNRIFKREHCRRLQHVNIITNKQDNYTTWIATRHFVMQRRSPMCSATNSVTHEWARLISGWSELNIINVSRNLFLTKHTDRRQTTLCGTQMLVTISKRRCTSSACISSSAVELNSHNLDRSDQWTTE